MFRYSISTVFTGCFRTNDYFLKPAPLAIEQFLEKTLHPIIDDNEFFSAITKPEYGTYNEKGHFEINSERSLELMVCEMLKICIELERKVDSFAEQYLAPYLLT